MNNIAKAYLQAVKINGEALPARNAYNLPAHSQLTKSTL